MEVEALENTVEVKVAPLMEAVETAPVKLEVSAAASMSTVFLWNRSL